MTNMSAADKTHSCSPTNGGRCDRFDRTKSCRRRCESSDGVATHRGRHTRCSISQTIPTLTVAMLVLCASRSVSATIILNTGMSPSAPPPAAPFPASACPSVCFCDETNYVNCVGDDSLWEVPADLPRSVVRLELRNYAIGTLAVQGALQELLDLHEVKLQQTKIVSIENGTFGNLTRLLRLDLSQNQLQRITSAMFEGLTSLRYLDLSTNMVADMDEAFLDLVNLEQLNLRDNRLPRLTVKSFPGLYKIQYLNLDSNLIASVEVGAFQYLTGLAHLIVSNNPLTTLSRLDFFGSRLQYIDVSRVGLQRVPQSLTRYVRDLRLAKNNLTHVRLGDFDSYPYISLLVLDDNRIEEIEGDALGRQEYLVRLWLNGNRLQHVPANLPPGLRVLYAEENLLRALPALSFQGLFNLEQLFLQRNLIERIDACAFCDLISLRHLNLQANQLESVSEGAFANLSSLVSLDLSQNPIKTLSAGCFVGLDALRILQLSRIKTFGRLEESAFAPLKRLETLEVYDSPALAAQLVNSTRALQGLRGLRELNLMHNNLAALRSDFPHFFPQLKVVKLSGNPWNCASREVRWMSAWINRTEIQFFHSYDIRCSRPVELLYKPLLMLRDGDFDRLTTAKLATTASTPTQTTTNDSVLDTLTTTTPSSTPVTAAPTATATVAAISVTKEQPKNNSHTLSAIDSNQSSNSTSNLNDNSTDDSNLSPFDLETEVTFNSSLANTSASGLDFDLTNLESENDEVDLLDEVTPLPTSAALLSSAEPETTTVTSQTSSSTTPVAVTPVANDEDASNTTSGLNPTASTMTDLTETDSTSQIVNQSATTAVSDVILVRPPPSTSSDAKSTPATIPSLNADAGSRPTGNYKHRVRTANSTLSVGPASGVTSATVAVASVAAGIGLLALGLTLSLLLFRWRRRYWPVDTAYSSTYSFCSLSSSSTDGLSGLINRHMRRSSSSISYSPQRDEVSIVTVSEGTVGLRTLTHQGLSNKLYFVLENGTDPAAINREALPDDSLQQLLPSPAWPPGADTGAGDPLLCPLYAPQQQQHHHHHPPSKRKPTATRSTSTYCFAT